MTTRNVSLGLLLLVVLVCGCGKSKTPDSHTAVSTSGGSSAGGMAGMAGTGGTAGAGGSAGAPYVVTATGVCPQHSTAALDAPPCACFGGTCNLGCVCYCDPGFPNACADGCFDTQSDLDHCGSCTAMCYATGQCNQGVCSTGVLPPPIPSPLVNGFCPPGSKFHDDDMLCYCPGGRSLRTTACAVDSVEMQPDAAAENGTFHTGVARAAGCVDTQTDADHCGSCDVVCAATAECNPTQRVDALNAAGDCPAGSLRNMTNMMCYAGACNAEPTVVVPASAGCGSIHLALADGVLFWTDALHGTVQSLTTGGAPTVIATDQMAPTLIQVNGSDVYWLNSGSNEIMTLSAVSGSATALVSVPSTQIGGFALSADGTTLYFSSGMLINKLTIANPATITEVGRYDSGVPKALAVEGDLVGFPTVDHTVQLMTEVAGDPSVCASPAATTAVDHNCTKVALAQKGVDLENVFIRDGVFYWVNFGQIQSSSPANRTAGEHEAVVGVTPPATSVTAFTIQGDAVYFADNTGLIVKAPLALNPPPTTKLARGQVDTGGQVDAGVQADAGVQDGGVQAGAVPVGVRSIVADNATLYWANPACEIMSLPTTTGDPI